MPNLSKIENLLKKLPLHRKIDLSLSRISRLNKDLNINLEKLQNKTITFTTTFHIVLIGTKLAFVKAYVF